MYYKYKDFKIYTKNTLKEKKSKLKLIFMWVVILFAFQVESIAYSSYVNGMFNTSFFIILQQ